MKLASIAEVKARLSEYVERCDKEAIVVTKHGHPRAALIPLRNDADLERLLLSQSPKFLSLLARAARSGTVSLADAKRALSSKRKAARGAKRRPASRRS